MPKVLLGHFFTGEGSSQLTDALLSLTSIMFFLVHPKVVLKSSCIKVKSEFLQGLKKPVVSLKPLACGRFFRGLAHLSVYEPAEFFHSCYNS